jgi:hypothetical protein
VYAGGRSCSALLRGGGAAGWCGVSVSHTPDALQPSIPPSIAAQSAVVGGGACYTYRKRSKLHSNCTRRRVDASRHIPTRGRGLRSRQLATSRTQTATPDFLYARGRDSDVSRAASDWRSAASHARIRDAKRSKGQVVGAFPSKLITVSGKSVFCCLGGEILCKCVVRVGVLSWGRGMIGRRW